MSLSRVPARKGFTLIELLVVIAIIAVLIALLVPAVQKVRAAAARAQCANNLKQWGLAMHAYHNQYNQFPLGSTGYSAASTPPNTITARNTWIPYVWPYVEQQSLFEQWNFTIGWNNPQNTVQLAVNSPICAPISLYYCPSDRGATEPAYDKNDNYWRMRGNYVASLGPYTSPPSTADVGNGVFGFQVLSSGNGFFFDLTHPLQTRINQITNGTSNTLMMSESIMSALDAAGGDQRGDVFNDDMLAMAWGFSSIQPPNSLTNDIQPACGGSTLLSPCTQGTTGTYISARSWHPGGVNALYADGHVDFMGNSVSPSIWATMGTRDGVSAGAPTSNSLQNGNFMLVPLTNRYYSGSDSVSYYTDGNGYIYAANVNFPNPAGPDNPFFPAGTTTYWNWGGNSVLVLSGAWAYDTASWPSGTTMCCSLQNIASISQTVNLTAGTHTLSFYLVQRPGSYYGQNPVTVSVNGTALGSPITPPQTLGPNGNPTWTPYTLSFPAPTAGAYTIMFATSAPSNNYDSDTGITAIFLN